MSIAASTIKLAALNVADAAREVERGLRELGSRRARPLLAEQAVEALRFVSTVLLVVADDLEKPEEPSGEGRTLAG